MTGISRIVKILEKHSDDERREVRDFAEFLLARRSGANRKSGPRVGRRSEGSSGGAWEIDYDDYDDHIR